MNEFFRALDIKLFHFLNDFAGKSPVFDAFITFLAAYFQYFLAAAFFLLLYFASYSKRRKFFMFWTTFVSAAASRAIFTEIIRFLYHRPRPFIAFPTNKILSGNWLYADIKWSFPSGHSAFFFAMAAAIWLYNKKWGAWFFIAAILMNIARVIAGLHYLSDIAGGAAIGIITAYLIFKLTEKKISA